METIYVCLGKTLINTFGGVARLASRKEGNNIFYLMYAAAALRTHTHTHIATRMASVSIGNEMPTT